MNGLEQEDNGEGVEKDEGKAIHHLEEAAMGGHPRARYDLGLGEATIGGYPEARYNLGANEWTNNRNDRAVKHWIIAATLGEDESIKMLMEKYKKRGLSRKRILMLFSVHTTGWCGCNQESAEESQPKNIIAMTDVSNGLFQEDDTYLTLNFYIKIEVPGKLIR
eukprot:scaffold8428_cov151-Skeletonema_menzelii.AAC.6